MSEQNTVGTPPVNLDDILIKFSLSGRYYVGFIIMMFCLFISEMILISDYVFIAEKAKYWCADERFGNDSCASLINSTEVCMEWVYEDPHSFVAEFQLACQEWKRTLVGTVQSLGYGVSLLMTGPLSDRFGRKILIITAVTLSSTAGVARSVAPNYWTFIILQLLGSTFGNFFSPAFILMIEMVANKNRVLIRTICSMGLTLGYVFLGLVAWLVPYWRQTLVILYSPGILFISYIFLLDESPRWLLSKGRKAEAVAILESAAKRSKVKLDKEALDKLTCEVNKDVTLKQSLNDTFKSNILLKRFFMCMVWWNIGTFCTYATRINSVHLPGDKYVNFVIYGLLTTPSYWLTLWCLNKFTRKISLVSTFYLCAAIFFVEPFVPKNLNWLSILLYMSGTIFVSMFFGIMYIFTSELFPTRTRNSMHSLCSASGRVGSILAPQTPLLIIYWEGFPSFTFGIATLVAGTVTLFAPKTSNDVLPDNVRQAEAIGSKQTQTVK